MTPKSRREVQNEEESFCSSTISAQIKSLFLVNNNAIDSFCVLAISCKQSTIRPFAE